MSKQLKMGVLASAGHKSAFRNDSFPNGSDGHAFRAGYFCEEQHSRLITLYSRRQNASDVS